MNELARGLASALLALGTVATVAAAKEVTIQRGDLPSAVWQSMQARYPGAEFLGFAKETEKGKVFFEAEMKVSGRHVDALFDSKGILQVEEAQVSIDDLPAKVRSAFAGSRHSKGTIERIERLTNAEEGSPPRYEIIVREGRALSELMFDAKGKLLGKKKLPRID